MEVRQGGADWFTITTAVSLADPVEAYALDIVQRPDGSRLGLLVAEPGIILKSTDDAPPGPSSLENWVLTFDIQDVCLNPTSYPCIPLAGCEQSSCTDDGTVHFEPWDVEISRNPDPLKKLALLVGGFGNTCGLVLSSVNDGATWCKELHECIANPGLDCSNPTNYLYNPNPAAPNDPYRNQFFKTLYGVAIHDGNNMAVAAGYHGQQVVRDPATGVWLDRSRFSTFLPTPQGSVKFPLYGADLAGGLAEFPSPTIIMTGAGGFLRESTDGGHNYVDKAVGDSHRTKDVYFHTNNLGWQVSELFRIAVSDDEGESWTEQKPDASAGLNFRAITFDSDATVGVAVGDPYVPAGGSSQPRIRYTMNGGQNPWQENVSIIGDATYIAGKALREVEWAGGPEFWAVGRGGLILHSRNHPSSWSLYKPEPTLGNFDLEGVAFKGMFTGLFVGRRPNGTVYQYNNLFGTPTWGQIALPILPGGVVISNLTDVDIAGNVAWAVGEKMVNNVREGIVITSTFSNGTFGAFTLVSPAPPTFPLCTVGDDLLDPILIDVEVAPNGAVWVGGMCGRMWMRSTSGTWTEVKSQTDSHVLGFSFPATGTGGFVACMRQSDTNHCIVKVQ